MSKSGEAKVYSVAVRTTDGGYDCDVNAVLLTPKASLSVIPFVYEGISKWSHINLHESK